jgi:hypothetical protein
MLKDETDGINTSDESVSKAVAHFSLYTKEIQSLISDISNLEEHDIKESIFQGILNGKASFALQQLVPVKIRRQVGLFFTSSVIAEQVASRLAPMLQRGFRILDPACGAGNLLLACARHLPIGRDLGETLRLWSHLILGYDRYSAFIEAAQLRLALLAITFHWGERDLVRSIQPNQIFIGLKACDALVQPPVDRNTCIIVNPPFGHVQAPADCKWATGMVQSAALFIEQILNSLTDGLHLVAILPDVLRSGTRYRKWRDAIASSCSSVEVELAGRFDNSTDVDVFIMHAIKGPSDARRRGQWPVPNLPASHHNHTVSEFFDVHVGPVVPHRDVLDGPSYPYVHARIAPAWQTIDQIVEQRCFTGKVFGPPFVVVHRTSSPRDKHRCVATIIDETRPVAVENHLLVLMPHDKSLKSCKELLSVFKSHYTDEWLNWRIRCRHLTVSAIRELPCPSVGKKLITNYPKLTEVDGSCK